MTDLEKFCRLVKARSDENKKAFRLVHHSNLTGQVISLLRQELDSMVRIIYLLNLDELNYRNHLIKQTLNCERWRKLENNSIITDKQMVDIADSLNGWTQSVYKFGCAFIHLSNFHDYKNVDPFANLPEDEKDTIKQHLNHYHSFPLTENLSVDTLKWVLPMVFDKVSGNLEYYIRDLKAEKIGLI